jgi:hypothetical protein
VHEHGRERPQRRHRLRLHPLRWPVLTHVRREIAR